MSALRPELTTGLAAGHQRHRPEDTLLYRIVEQHYPRFAALMDEQGRALPGFVQREFAAYLKCGRLEHGFLRVRCNACHAEKLVAFSCKRRGLCPSCGARRMVDSAALLVDEVLPAQPVRQWVLSVPFALRFLFAREPSVMGAVSVCCPTGRLPSSLGLGLRSGVARRRHSDGYDSSSRLVSQPHPVAIPVNRPVGQHTGIVIRAIEANLIAEAGYARACARSGAVTLIQRFGGALNLNLHFHMLFLDGVYVSDAERGLRFARVAAPTPLALSVLLEEIARRVARYLERRGWLACDGESAYLQYDPERASPLDELLGAAITYRIAIGPQRGQKAFTLQTLPAAPAADHPDQVARTGGFTLHAGVAAEAHQRDKLERLCRYVARPAVASERLSLTRQGDIRVALKTPWRDGTTHIVFTPLDFISRLVALIPRPRVNLTRFHGVFAPHSAWRAQITPAGRGRRRPAAPQRSESEKHQAMSWAQRLKRVFRIDVETCEHCGGAMRIIACIEDPVVIDNILAHIACRDAACGSLSHPPRAPPGG